MEVKSLASSAWAGGFFSTAPIVSCMEDAAHSSRCVKAWPRLTSPLPRWLTPWPGTRVMGVGCAPLHGLTECPRGVAAPLPQRTRPHRGEPELLRLCWPHPASTREEGACIWLVFLHQSHHRGKPLLTSLSRAPHLAHKTELTFVRSKCDDILKNHSNFFFFLAMPLACGILVPRAGIKQAPVRCLGSVESASEVP